MKDLKGTKTEKNLTEAFGGESQANTKYTIYADRAREDGFEQIAAIFEETAHNEEEHAKIWFKQLHSGMPDTWMNLLDAAAGEHRECADMYVRMAAEAKQEGFDELARLFGDVGKIECEHEKRYRALIKNVEEGKVFRRETPQVWQCRNCGNEEHALAAPEVCDVCGYPRAYFQIKCENY